MSDDLRDLLKGLLQKNPQHRISFEEFSMHRFLNDEENDFVDSEIGFEGSRVFSPKSNLKKRTLPRQPAITHRKSSENPKSPRARGPISIETLLPVMLTFLVDEFQSSPPHHGPWPDNLAILRRFSSPSVVNITGGSPSSPRNTRSQPILDPKTISATMIHLCKSEKPEQAFQLCFRALQVLHELLNSGEFLGHDKNMIEIQIRELVNVMQRQSEELDSTVSLPNFFLIVLKQVMLLVSLMMANSFLTNKGYEAVSFEKQTKYRDAGESYRRALWYLEFLDLWSNSHPSMDQVNLVHECKHCTLFLIELDKCLACGSFTFVSLFHTTPANFNRFKDVPN